MQIQVNGKPINGGSLIRQMANSLFDVFIYLFQVLQLKAKGL